MYAVNKQGLNKRRSFEQTMNTFKKVYPDRVMQSFKNLKDILEAHTKKKESIIFRKNLLETQRRTNYTNELERIKGILSSVNSGLNDESIDRLKKRREELKKLGGKAVEGIN